MNIEFTDFCFYLIFSRVLGSSQRCQITPQPLYNTVRYNTVLYITRFEDGSQKCIDYIEK